MIKVTYKNKKGIEKDEFIAKFETIRGANMFIDQLKERDIEFSVSNF